MPIQSALADAVVSAAEAAGWAIGASAVLVVAFIVAVVISRWFMLADEAEQHANHDLDGEKP